MKLNLSILADDLVDYKPAVYVKNPLKLAFSSFAQFKDQRELKQTCLYLIDADDLTPELAAIEGINWLCFGEASNYVLQYRKCDVCMLTRTRALSSFIALLSSIFAKYNDWSERVLTLSLRSDGIRALFNSGAITDIMENPVLMQNGDGSFGIFCGTLPVDFDNPSWKQLLDGGVLQDAQTMGSLSERRIRDSLKEPFIIEKTKKYNFLATNALLDGKFQGRLNYCDSERSFTPGFMALANYLNDIFSDVIARDLQRGVVGQDKNNMFVELLNVWHSDKKWVDYHLRQIGWPRMQPMRAVVSILPNKARMDEHIERIIRDRLTVLFPDEPIVGYDQTLVSIVRSSSFEHASDIVKALERSFPDGDVRHAISLVFFDVGKLRVFFDQCMFVLDDEDREGDEIVRLYGGSFFKHFVEETGIGAKIAQVLSPRIDLLRSHDEENGTDLVGCLLAYIECHFNKKATAARLNVHYNTLVYRLERISEICFIDLDEIALDADDELFHILLSCKLIEEERKETEDYKEVPDRARKHKAGIELGS